MQIVSEVMTRDVRFVSPRESLQRAAQLMDELNVGALPVCDGERLVGMVTDRDITVRATAAGKAPQDAHVEEVMSADVRWCFEDQPLDEVLQQMSDTQIRRVPVVSHDDNHRLIGIVALGDLATRTSGGARKREVEQAVEHISSPSEPDRSPVGSSASGTVRASRTGTGTASDDLDAVLGSAGVGASGGDPNLDQDEADIDVAGGNEADASGASIGAGKPRGAAGTAGPSGSDAGARP